MPSLYFYLPPLMYRKFRIISLLITALSSCMLIACVSSSRHDSARKLILADSILASGDTLVAVEILSELIAGKFQKPEMYAKLGSIYRAKGSIKGRLLSQKIIEEGERLFPNSKKILFELGKTYYEQTFYPDAEQRFHSVLGLDSTYCEAWHYLGLNSFRKWMRNHSYEDELSNARFYLSRAVDCNPEEWRWAFLLAFAKYALRDSSGCRIDCKKMIVNWPNNARIRMLSGVLNFEKGLYIMSSSEFYKALALASEEERELYLDISLLLEGDKKKQYLNASPEKKKDIRRIFWLMQDPDPTTSVNERYLEHLARVTQADLYFSVQHMNIRGYETDRGVALIKFGWPSHIGAGLGKRLDGRFEKWLYSGPEEIYKFTFVDEFLNDNFAIPISNGSMKQQLDFAPPLSSLVRDSLSIPGQLSTFSFKDGPASSSVYAIVTLDGASLSKHSQSPESSDFNIRGSVFDSGYKELSRFSGSFGAPFSDSCGNLNPFFLKILSLPFDNYHFALAIESRQTPLQAVFMGDVNTSRYIFESLSMSDIVLYDSQSRASCNSFITRKGSKIPLKIEPHFRKGEKLGIYFEVYNLKLKQLRSSFEISYEIYAFPKKKTSTWSRVLSGIRHTIGMTRSKPPAIIQTVDRSGAKHNQEESIIIDINSLEEGRYDLKVSAIDFISGEKIEGSVIFYKTISD